MVATVLHTPPREEFVRGFDRIRARHDVPTRFSPEIVSAAADAAAQAGGQLPGDRVDLRNTPFIAIDPAGSRDLDQALHLRRRNSGLRLLYAIADVAAFVEPGGVVDREARARGVTVYLPDARSSLHPEVLNEGSASLLPGPDRPAVVWTVDLDQRGEIVDARAERASVACAAALSYDQAQAAADGHPGPASADHVETLRLLREFGELRAEAEARRGGVSLNLPSQKVVESPHGWRVEFEQKHPVEDWNAQVSLATGIAAAAIMADAKVGLLRTLPPADPEVVAGLRLQAEALGVLWPSTMGYPERIRTLKADTPQACALLTSAARALRGAGYLGFTGSPPPDHAHHAIAAPYAHVTAPLRRLVDRFSAEIAVAHCAGAPIPAWVVAGLETVPDQMQAARRRAAAVTRDVVDFCEATVLASQIGEIFPAVALSANDGRAKVQIQDPAIVATVDHDGIEPGDRLLVQVIGADPAEAQITLSVAQHRD